MRLHFCHKYLIAALLLITVGITTAMAGNKGLKPENDTLDRWQNKGGEFGLGCSTFPLYMQSKNLRFKPWDAQNFNISQRFYQDDICIRVNVDFSIRPQTDYKYFISDYSGGIVAGDYLSWPHLWYYGGTDVMVGSHSQAFSTYRSTDTRIGPCPVAGLLWRPTPHLSFYTELSWMFALRLQGKLSQDPSHHALEKEKYSFLIAPWRMFGINIAWRF